MVIQLDSEETRHIRVRSVPGWKWTLGNTLRVHTALRLPDGIPSAASGFVTLTPQGELTIRAGYSWDGATGAFDTRTNLLASAAHDALCQLVRSGLIPWSERELIHAEYYRLCLRDGMGKFRAWLEWKAVRRFGLRGMKAEPTDNWIIVP